MKKMKERKRVLLLLLAIIIAIFVASVAEANTSTNFPWDSALKSLADSLTGPVAFSLGLFMVVCGFCGLAFMGSELGGWIRWVSLAAFLAGMLGSAPTVLSMFGLQSVLLP